MGAADWDARYAGTELVWGSGANRYVVQHTADLPPGRAVDLACGEGRNARYLAGRGWSVTGVDFSAVAIDKARRLEATVHGDPATTRSQRTRQAGVPPDGDAGPDDPTDRRAVEWICADVIEYLPDPADLIMLIYLHLPSDARRTVLGNVSRALRPGGRLLMVGHHTRNITDGTGGPQDPEILYTPDDLVTDLSEVAADLVAETAAAPERDVPGAARPAIDTVLRARRP